MNKTADDKTNKIRPLKGVETKHKLDSAPKARVPSPTNAKKKETARQRPKKQPRYQVGKDETLGVIQDQRSGQTFYISLIDNFTYKGKEYAVMYNYRAEDNVDSMPEISIMRTYRDQAKQYFTSIRDKKELDMIFDIFYDRFQQSI